MPPVGNDYTIDTFLRVVTRAIEDLDPNSLSQRVDYNLTQEENKALLALEQDSTIVLKPADKGGNLVIMSHEQYRKMCLKILTDPEKYKVLENDPTLLFRD